MSFPYIKAYTLSQKALSKTLVIFINLRFLCPIVLVLGRIFLEFLFLYLYLHKILKILLHFYLFIPKNSCTFALNWGDIHIHLGLTMFSYLFRKHCSDSFSHHMIRDHRYTHAIVRCANKMKILHFSIVCSSSSQTPTHWIVGKDNPAIF